MRAPDGDDDDESEVVEWSTEEEEEEDDDGGSSSSGSVVFGGDDDDDDGSDSDFDGRRCSSSDGGSSVGGEGRGSSGGSTRSTDDGGGRSVGSSVSAVERRRVRRSAAADGGTDDEEGDDDDDETDGVDDNDEYYASSSSRLVAGSMTVNGRRSSRRASRSSLRESGGRRTDGASVRAGGGPIRNGGAGVVVVVASSGVDGAGGRSGGGRRGGGMWGPGGDASAVRNRGAAAATRKRSEGEESPPRSGGEGGGGGGIGGAGGGGGAGGTSDGVSISVGTRSKLRRRRRRRPEETSSPRRRRRRGGGGGGGANEGGVVGAVLDDAVDLFRDARDFFAGGSAAAARGSARLSTAAFAVSLVIWLYVRARYSSAEIGRDGDGDVFRSSKWRRGEGRPPTPPPPFEERLRDRPAHHHLREADRIASLREERRKESHGALGSAAGNLFSDMWDAVSGTFGLKKKPKRKKKRGTVEDLPPGCAPAPWHKLSFPNCNDLHDVDLREQLHMTRFGRKLPDVGRGDKVETAIDPTEAKAARETGYVGSGLWRGVWKVDPRGESTASTATSDDDDGGFVAPAVLKMMKPEHEYDERNYDRHRRDALVMERLTSSDHVVSMYGFCGNTVLTEYVGMGLDQILYQKRGSVAQERDARDGDGRNGAWTRETPMGRLRLALGVARGLADLHETDGGGPILHADVQAKQYLVHPVRGVQINDFNRCRFLPISIDTGRPCPIRIPSAPGGSRSPEEYAKRDLTEKMDVYSVANVLYGILTGTKPYGGMTSSQIQTVVKEGKIPPLEVRYRREGTSDEKLAYLTERAYEFDPRKRISARVLAEELERLVNEEEEKRRQRGAAAAR